MKPPAKILKLEIQAADDTVWLNRLIAVEAEAPTQVRCSEAKQGHAQQEHRAWLRHRRVASRVRRRTAHGRS